MNKTYYTIERAYDMNSKGFDKQVGWDIFARCEGFSTTNWCNRYSLLRDAKHALALEGIKAIVVH
jgi:hypothetical protein